MSYEEDEDVQDVWTNPIPKPTYPPAPVNAPRSPSTWTRERVLRMATYMEDGMSKTMAAKLAGGGRWQPPDPTDGEDPFWTWGREVIDMAHAFFIGATEVDLAASAKGHFSPAAVKAQTTILQRAVDGSDVYRPSATDKTTPTSTVTIQDMKVILTSGTQAPGDGLRHLASAAWQLDVQPDEAVEQGAPAQEKTFALRKRT